MTKLQILSDIHTESWKDAAASFMRGLPVEADTLIVAGDLGIHLTLPFAIDLLCERWETVIYVTGNHEYKKVGREPIHNLLEKAQDKHAGRFHWLNNEAREIGGIKFYGGAMWYPYVQGNEVFEPMMWEFVNVPGIREWVYKENRAFIEGAIEHVNEDVVAISHHLPCMRSVLPRYRGQPLNRFFVCPLGEFIEVRQPIAWIHGHTHGNLDYYHGKTMVLCNPVGYGFRRNRDFNPSLCLEVE